jgi:uncharacterized protein (TIGR02246 family)
MLSMPIKAMALVLISCSLAAGRAKATDSPAEDAAAISKVVADFARAYNSHDAHAEAMLFAEDADFINAQAKLTKGRDGVEEHMKPLFAGPLKAAHREITVRAVRFLHSDTAVVDCDVVITGMIGENGTPAPAQQGFYDWIVTKQRGHWLITHWHEVNFPLSPPSTSTPAR